MGERRGPHHPSPPWRRAAVPYMPPDPTPTYGTRYIVPSLELCMLFKNVTASAVTVAAIGSQA